ncbi:MAG TPA: TadE/TadG family type IV pilus assembly protein [Terriglobales bacterium]|nr:TadE/TadG family type IV pilus assembly protein [Terriglobales bacterium]
MRNQRGYERGATLVEGAITILLFFTLILANIEFGRAYNQYQVMTDAAREGARFSVAPFSGTNTLPTTTAVQAEVQRFLDSAGVRGATISVTQNVTATINNVPVTHTQVTVNAPYTFFFFRFGSVGLSTTATMRNETSP